MSDTQDTQAPVDGVPAAPAGTPPAPASNGVQERIDQLVAQIHGFKDQLAQVGGMNDGLMAQNARLVEQLTARGSPQEQHSAPPPDGLDPAHAQWIAQQVQTPLLKEIQALKATLMSQVGSLTGNQEQMALQAAIANESPAVKADAMKLYQEAKATGLQGWSPQNLLWMARGRAAQTQAPRGNGSDAVTPGGGGVPNPVAPSGVPRKSDADLAKMSRDQRIAYYESAIGDEPIQY